MSNTESGIIRFRPREQMTIPLQDDFNGATVLKLNPVRKPSLRLVEPSQVDDQKILPFKPKIAVVGDEVFEMNKNHVAPEAGERAKKIQSSGARKMDDEVEKYQTTGVFTQATAKAIGNTFIRLRAIGEGSGISNISESAWIPEMQDSAQACSLLKKMGDIIAPKDAHVTEYGRLVMYVWDVEELDYQRLSADFTNAPREIIEEFSPKNEATELNKLQDQRAVEFQRKEDIFKGILEGTVDPGIPAVPDEKENLEDSVLLWGSKRTENKIYAISPDLELYDEEKLGDTDIWTKGLLAHERDLTLSAPKGKIRVIMVLANDAFVRRCCVTVTNYEDFINNFVGSTPKLDTSSEAIPFVYGDTVGAIYNGGGNYEVYHNTDYCSNCKSRKNKKGECVDCSAKESKST